MDTCSDIENADGGVVATGDDGAAVGGDRQTGDRVCVAPGDRLHDAPCGPKPKRTDWRHPPPTKRWMRQA